MKLMRECLPLTCRITSVQKVVQTIPTMHTCTAAATATATATAAAAAAAAAAAPATATAAAAAKAAAAAAGSKTNAHMCGSCVQIRYELCEAQTKPHAPTLSLYRCILETVHAERTTTPRQLKPNCNYKRLHWRKIFTSGSTQDPGKTRTHRQGKCSNCSFNCNLHRTSLWETAADTPRVRAVWISTSYPTPASLANRFHHQRTRHKQHHHRPHRTQGCFLLQGCLSLQL
jgi:hypothetical protein